MIQRLAPKSFGTPTGERLPPLRPQEVVYLDKFHRDHVDSDIMLIMQMYRLCHGKTGNNNERLRLDTRQTSRPWPGPRMEHI